MRLAAWLLAGAVALFLLENIFPLRQRTQPLRRRLPINLAFGALAVLVAALLVRPAAETALAWADEHNCGLLHWITLPPAAAAVVAFLLLDLSFYWWHRANHRVPILWRQHRVHHSDPDLDVSTAARFHVFELGLSAGFRAVQVAVTGVPVGLFAAYEIVFQLGTAFHHSNLRLPLPLERVLGVFLVTPRMHGIHHSQIREETDSNYSAVLPWWDFLHRSLRRNTPQDQIVIGIPASGPEQNRPVPLFLLPFRRRDDWQGRLRREPELSGPRSRIAS